MAVHALDVEALLPVEEQLDLAQLPVGNVGQVLGFAFQGEGCDLFLAQLDDVLLVTGQTGGSFHVGQLGIADLFFHVGDELGLAFVLGIGNTGGVIEGIPVRIGEQLLEDFLTLDGGLCGFVVSQPALQPAETEVGGHEEGQDEQEIEGVEDDGAGAGALFLLLNHNGLHRGGLAGRGDLDLGSALAGCGGLGLGGCVLTLLHQLVGSHVGGLILRIKFSFVHSLLLLSPEPSSSSAYVWAETAAENSC